MKHKCLFAGATALVLITATLPSFASDNRVGLLGETSDPRSASRTIILGPDTAYVNVTRGEIVKFVVGDKAFSWNFGGASTISEIDLNLVAPPGMLTYIVKAYIKRNPFNSDGA